MRKLAGLMNKRREERGSIDFDLPEPVIEFDELGQIAALPNPSAPGQSAHRRIHAGSQRVRGYVD